MTIHGAFVTRIKVREHPNADRLALGQVGGFQVVIGKDTPDESLGVFFSSELRVSPEYAKANGLLSEDGGYFPKNLKVRPQRFRGEQSDGYFAPLSSLEFTGFDVSTLKVGDIFTELNGVPICEKYVVPTKSKDKGAPKLRKQNPFFAKHHDTEQLGYYYQDIPVGSLVSFTLKMHGTSGRTGYVLDPVTRKRTWLDRLLRRKPVEEYAWTLLTGTRNTVLDQWTGDDFYGTDEFRRKAAAMFNDLHEGEVVYYEIVGWVDEQTPIMGTHNFKSTKEFKSWGDGVVYAYGQPRGTFGVYVYRITRTTKDRNGFPVVTELSWPQVKQRCHELGVNHVPEIGNEVSWVVREHSAYDQEGVLSLARTLCDGPDPLDPSHPREGVVVRVDTPDGRSYALKHKGLTFKVGEGIAKEDGDEDLEEQS